MIYVGLMVVAIMLYHYYEEKKKSESEDNTALTVKDVWDILSCCGCLTLIFILILALCVIRGCGRI